MRRVIAFLLMGILGIPFADVHAQRRPGNGNKKPPASKIPKGNGSVDWGPVTKVDAASLQHVRDVAKDIDRFITSDLIRNQQQPNPRLSDELFVRRVYLEIGGRIPRLAEIGDFVTSKDARKREKLIDKLLSSHDYVSHTYNYWADILRLQDHPINNNQIAQPYHEWIKDSIRTNMPYDEWVHTMLTAEGRIWENPAVGFAMRDSNMELDAVDNMVQVFLGTQIGCAQCHDHPFDDWKQEDFWGYAAFFARLPKNDNMVRGRNFRLTDRMEGDVTLPETETVVLPKYPGGEASSQQDYGTRRQQLSIWMASPDNPYVARAAVNRIWSMLFGRGLVNPVDDLGPHNPASHPELLETLTNYFIDTQYDLRNLLRVLCSTDAYSRTSQVDPAAVPAPELFAAMAVKVQTAEQLYDSLSRCLSQSEQEYSPFPGVSMDGRRQQFLTKMVSRSADATEYDRGLQQALKLMNGSETSEATDLERSSLLTSLEAPFLSDTQRIEILYLATLTRFPTAAEIARAEEFIAADSTNEGRRMARADVLWALLNSAEFTMNK